MMDVIQLGTKLGAEIRGVDLKKPLNEASSHTIHEALMDHGVLVFRDQAIKPEHQIAFGKQFGALTVHPFSPSLPENPELIILDNNQHNPPRLTDVWHSDETFREEPPMGTILRAVIVPPIGGDTLFASMTAAFEGLSDRMQHFIMDLEAVHDFKPFRSLFNDSEEDKKKRRQMEDMYPNPNHPIVRIHPVTGKKVLFVSPQFTVAIKGLHERESRSILDILFHQAEIPDHQFRVQWQPDTLVFWDNRSVQHYAVHDYYPHRRRMERITLKGDRPYGPSAAEGKDTEKEKQEGIKENDKGPTEERPKRPFERQET
jgi:taurine dioxygenase